MTPSAIAAIEAALRLGRRWKGIGTYPDPLRYFEEGIEHAERLCEEANRDLAAFLAVPADVPLEDVELERVSGSTTTWSFRSPLPSGRPRNDRVSVRLHVRPSTDRSARAILFHHPLFQRRWDAWDWFLSDLIDRAPLAMMAAPYHVDRVPEGEFAGEGYVNPNPWRLFEAIRQWTWDQAAARRLLAERIGLEISSVAGFSMGAFQSLLLGAVGALDVPLIAIACTNRYAFGIRHGVIGGEVRKALDVLGIAPERFERMVRSLQLELWAPRLRDRPVLWVAGRYDRVDPPPSGERLESALRPRRSLRVDAGHATLLLYRGRVWREIEAFLVDVGVIAPRGTPPPSRPDGRSGGGGSR